MVRMGSKVEAGFALVYLLCASPRMRAREGSGLPDHVRGGSRVVGIEVDR